MEASNLFQCLKIGRVRFFCITLRLNLLTLRLNLLTLRLNLLTLRFNLLTLRFNLLTLRFNFFFLCFILLKRGFIFSTYRRLFIEPVLGLNSMFLFFVVIGFITPY